MKYLPQFLAHSNPCHQSMVPGSKFHSVSAFNCGEYVSLLFPRKNSGSAGRVLVAVCELSLYAHCCFSLPSVFWIDKLEEHGGKGGSSKLTTGNLFHHSVICTVQLANYTPFPPKRELYGEEAGVPITTLLRQSISPGIHTVSTDNTHPVWWCLHSLSFA